MKRIILLTLIVCSFAATTFAQVKTDTIKVKGNCEHCKERIEKASMNVNGVLKAEWNSDDQKLVISYDAAKTSNDEVQKAIAKVGHDTEKYRAEDKVYKQLPPCCEYTRATAHEYSPKGMQTFEFTIKGMTCAEGCAGGIQNALYRQKGVKVSEVNFLTEKAKVVYDPSKISKQQIISIIESFQPEGELIQHTYKVIEIE